MVSAAAGQGPLQANKNNIGATKRNLQFLITSPLSFLEYLALSAER
jgi:hypothetical protein